MKLPKELQKKEKAKKEKMSRRSKRKGKGETKKWSKFSNAKKINKFRAIIDSKPSGDIQKQIYQLKITISNISPPIWRRILILNRENLQVLHKHIQKWFNWKEAHPHEFFFFPEKDRRSQIRIKGAAGLFAPGPSKNELNEKEVRLYDIFGMNVKRLWYLYDFGDNWEHEIKLEKVFPYKKDFKKPICVGGKRAGPPEDCGGPWGYKDLLGILDDPKHPRHSELSEWVGDNFDPENMGINIEEMTPQEIEQKYGSES
ncbi:MAG: plasmid pRiA4b ORF-3 family protein [Promethearchaeia archaeon]